MGSPITREVRDLRKNGLPIGRYLCLGIAVGGWTRLGSEQEIVGRDNPRFLGPRLRVRHLVLLL
jgi:hypothetical protein